MTLVSDTGVTLPAHSRLGASSAQRWMNCPGSVSLIRSMPAIEREEKDYQRLGSDAHELASFCLDGNTDTWEHVGTWTDIGDMIDVDQDMADAVQVYLDTVRPAIEEARSAGDKGKVLIEAKMSAPKLHEACFGTVDCAVILPDRVEITDYKHGEGMAVDVEENVQLMYYAFLVLHNNHYSAQRVILRIVQPRAHHQDGPVREWETTAKDIMAWANGPLLEAMNRTGIDTDLFVPGEHCQKSFCEAKLCCPALNTNFDILVPAAQAVVSLPGLSDEDLADRLALAPGIKALIKALEDEVFRRLNNSKFTDDRFKLVPKRADRVWKPEAPAIFTKEFGGEAMTTPKIKSPAEMSKVSPRAKTLVAEWAYTPQNGLTVAGKDDKRDAIKIESVKITFAHMIPAE